MFLKLFSLLFRRGEAEALKENTTSSSAVPDGAADLLVLFLPNLIIPRAHTQALNEEGEEKVC